MKAIDGVWLRLRKNRLVGNAGRNPARNLFFAWMCFILTPLIAQESIDRSLAKKYFQEAEALSKKDDGTLWGILLAGPLIFADPKTRSVVANRPDAEGKLVPADGLFEGILPADVNISDTATKWAGVKWTMVRWPLPDNRYDRLQLMAHELWHRIQNDIGFPATFPSNHHLDTPAGRLWLQLEWAALREALISTKSRPISRKTRAAELMLIKKNAIRDALIFRNYRRSLFPGAENEERELEMNEGLAAYTGLTLSGRTDPETKETAVLILKKAVENETFVRSFAYSTGPAYGNLLDATGRNWRKDLRKEDDLGTLTSSAYGIDLPENLKREAEQRASSFSGDSIRQKEADREKYRQEKMAEYRKRFLVGPVLKLPLRNINVQINPGNLQPLDSLGTVYPTIRVTDDWGILNVTGGALMHPSWIQITVTAPADPTARPLRGDGWTLELKERWIPVPGERTGDFQIQKK